MQKNLLLAAIMLLASSYLQAQQINYETSFEKAKAAALQQQKPIAVLITIDLPATVSNNTYGLKDKAVIFKFNSSFINYKVNRKDTAVTGDMIRNFKLFRFPTFVFLDAKGGLLFSDVAFLSKAEPLLLMADKAIAASKEMSMTDYDRAYAAGDSDRTFLKNYILKRQKAGLHENSDIIEKYVNSLSIADLNNYEEVLFILKAGPVVQGRAYSLAYTNKNIIDSIFKTLPLPDRVAMNNKTISNTMKKAIADKNVQQALAAANFTRGTWKSDPATGQKNWHLKMLQFYLGIKDTSNYLLQASNYYDRYYMQISVDSIQKKDSLKNEMAKTNAMKAATAVKINDSVSRKTFTVTRSKNNPVAVELNNAAWNFYNMVRGSEKQLLTAMAWSRRSVELEPLPAHYDTYAHILYKLGLQEEAEAMQRKAIELAVISKQDSKGYKAEYEKIKKRSL